MRALLLLVVLILLTPASALAQIDRTKTQKPVKQARPDLLKKIAQADSLVPAKLILPEDLNKEYQQKFKNLQEILRSNFNRNRSGKLQFCSKPDLIPGEWLESKYRFANTMDELDRFELLLCQLNIFYLQREIDQQGQYRILSLTRGVLRMKDKVIIIVDKNRKRVIPVIKHVMMNAMGVNIRFIPVQGKTNVRIEGAQVYAVTPAHFFDCETCADCLAPDSGCDINTLKGENNYDVTQMAPGTVLDPGSYYIFVTLMDYDVERVIYFENREIGMEDNGKVVRLGVR